MVTSIFVIVFSVISLWDLVSGQSFYGGTIRWKSDVGTGNTARFYWRAAWTIGDGPCGATCPATEVGSFVDNAVTGDWNCRDLCTNGGDTSFSSPMDYWLSAVNTDLGYETGENEFMHTFASTGPFYVGFSGSPWRDLGGFIETPIWNIWTFVQFGDRNDSLRPNNSPLVSALPVYVLELNCEAEITLPVMDPDGDVIKCRWGTTSDECANVCDALPEAIINPDSCTIKINIAAATHNDSGWYLATIIVEDFPRTHIEIDGAAYNPDDALSKVPIQFLVNVEDLTSTCDNKPEFVWPTPSNGEVFYIEPTESLGIGVYAGNSVSNSATIDDIFVHAPVGAVTSELRDDDHNDGRTRVKYRTVYWSPAQSQSGVNTICYQAVDSNNKPSEFRCIKIFANDIDECLADPCENDGVCTNVEGIHYCTCVSGTAGYNCSVDTIDECSSNPCMNNGTCTDDYSDFNCTCVVGFTGKQCEINIDECASGPCFNNGNCTDLVDGYVCNCPAGYTGTLCNEHINECDSSPCQMNGTCIDDFNDYDCVCVLGFNGKNCEINIDECLSSPCDNGATCTDVYGGYSCTCVSGYTGVFCERDIYECQSTPCQNGGHCVDQLGAYVCDCASGFTGINCETDIDECTSNPCVHGTCSDHIDKFECACDPGWTGIQCELDYNECMSIPCENNGQCNNFENGFNCTCTAGYTGEFCETDMNECDLQLCMNGATCVDGVNYFFCLCQSGFEGILCDINLDDCYIKPCLNNGTCQDNVNGFTCCCTDHWYGERCEKSDLILCSCNHETNWAAFGFDVQCECATNYALTKFKSELDSKVYCMRNVYSLALSFFMGSVIVGSIFGVLFFIQDLRQRYVIILRGGDPDDKTPPEPEEPKETEKLKSQMNYKSLWKSKIKQTLNEPKRWSRSVTGDAEKETERLMLSLFKWKARSALRTDDASINEETSFT